MYSGFTRENVERFYYQDMNLLLLWLRENKLVLNAEKCTLLCFGYKKSDNNIESLRLCPHNNPNCADCPLLQCQENVKYLGLYLDNKLSWGAHSIFLQKKLRKLNYLFFHLRECFSVTHLLKINLYCLVRIHADIRDYPLGSLSPHTPTFSAAEGSVKMYHEATEDDPYLISARQNEENEFKSTLQIQGANVYI